MSGAGEAGAAAINLALPAIQAAATILILDKQKDYHDEVADKRIDLIDDAVDNYITSMEACIASGIFSQAYGSIPTPAEYVPIDQLEEHYQAINSNLQNVPATDRLMYAVRELTVNSDILRMAAFCPAFLANAHKRCSTIKDLMHGKLPIDSAINVLTDNAEQALLTGRVGNIKQLNARSLGIERLRMQALARSEQNSQVQMVQSASPMQRQMTFQDMFRSPENRVGIALTQAQLIQNSLQNANNLNAAGDPVKLAELQVKLQKITTRLGQEAQRGNLVNSFVPDFASVLTPTINSISSALMGGRAEAPNDDTAGVTGTTSNSYQVDYGSGQVDQNGKN